MQGVGDALFRVSIPLKSTLEPIAAFDSWTKLLDIGRPPVFEDNAFGNKAFQASIEPGGSDRWSTWQPT